MENTQNPQWQRIEDVIRWANMTTNYFARHIGLPRGENLYQIKRGTYGISRALADRIVEHFPTINKAWLLTGEGMMFAPEAAARTIPYYEADLEKCLRTIDEMLPTSALELPPADACDLAIWYHSHEMEPLTQAGTVLLLKKVTTEAIIPHKEYVIITQNLVTLRIVRRDANPLYLRLTAADRSKVDDMVVRDEEVERIYAVRGKLILDK